jgi:Protein of unknown function (DUF1579)
MAQDKSAEDQSVPVPNPALKRLDRLVGVWRMKGRPLGAGEDSITGIATFKWLHKEDDAATGFYLQQDMELDYAGMPIHSHELIGFNPKTQAFASLVFSNMASEPWPYEWDVQGDTWTIAIRHEPMNAAFKAEFSADGNSFAGGWRPGPGADEKINAPYDVRGERIDGSNE